MSSAVMDIALSGLIVAIVWYISYQKKKILELERIINTACSWVTALEDRVKELQKKHNGFVEASNEAYDRRSKETIEFCKTAMQEWGNTFLEGHFDKYRTVLFETQEELTKEFTRHVNEFDKAARNICREVGDQVALKLHKEYVAALDEAVATMKKKLGGN